MTEMGTFVAAARSPWRQVGRAGPGLIAAGLVLALVANVAADPYAGAPFTDHADIGAVGLAGTASYEVGPPARHVNTAQGADIWDSADQFHFIYTQASGDSQVTADLIWPSTVTDNGTAMNDWAKHCIMFRQDLTPGSRHVIAANAFNNGLRLAGRATADQPSFDLYAYTPATKTARVRLTKLGNTFQEDYWNGANWVTGPSTTVQMDDPYYWGVATTSHDPVANGRVTGWVENLQVQALPNWATGSRTFGAFLYAPGVPLNMSIDLTVVGSPAIVVQETIPAGWTASAISNGGTAAGNVITWNLAAAAGNRTLTYVATPPAGASGNAAFGGTVVAAGLTTGIGGSNSIGSAKAFVGPIFDYHMDLGAVGLEGNSGYDNVTQVWTNLAQGADIWGTADQCHYMFEPASGDFRITAWLNWPAAGSGGFGEPVDGWAKHGIMIREKPTAGSKHATACITWANGVHMQSRPTENGDSADVGAGFDPFADPANITGDAQLRLTRAGNTFTLEYWNNNQWNVGGSTTIAMAKDVYWGIATTSHTTCGADPVCDPGIDYVIGAAWEITKEVLAGSVTRDIDALWYEPNEPIAVDLLVGVSGGAPTVTMSETVPAGWAVSGITDGGTAAGNVINWNLGAVAADKIVSYVVTPPGSVAGSTQAAQFTGTATIAGVQSVIGGENSLFPPAAVLVAPKVTDAVTMDGVINLATEYPNALRFTWDGLDNLSPGVCTGNVCPVPTLADFSGEAWIQHDDTSIYVAIRVTDDVQTYNNTDVWQSDSAELYVDSNNSNSNPKENGSLGFQATTTGDGTRYAGNDAPPGGTYWNCAAKVTDATHYEFEYVISKTGIGLADGGVAGFDVAYNDADGGQRDHQPWWWSTTGDAWNDERPWGVLVLEAGAQPPEAPDITAIAKSAGGVQLTWTSQAGVTYVVQSREAMGGAWADVATVPGQAGTTSYDDVRALSGSRFYQVLAQ